MDTFLTGRNQFSPQATWEQPGPHTQVRTYHGNYRRPFLDQRPGASEDIIIPLCDSKPFQTCKSPRSASAPGGSAGHTAPDRKCVENGVLAYCQQNEILLTAYTPIHHRYTQSNPTLKAVAQARGVTPPQTALAWLTTQAQVITIPMSFNPQHQAENLKAGDLVLSDAEMEKFGRIG